MKVSLSVWVLSALSTCALGSVAQKPYAMNSSTAPAVIPPPSASGTRLRVLLSSSSGPCNTLNNSSLSPTASVAPYPIGPSPASSFVTQTASPVLQTRPLIILPTPHDSVTPTSAPQSVNSPRVVNKAAAIAAVPASSTIDLELLSSILLSGLPDMYTKTRTATATSLASLTSSTPLPALSSGRVSSSLAATTKTSAAGTSSTSSASSTSSGASATEFPTLPPFSYNPSASRGSATPISRPTPESSSASLASSTLSTSSTPSPTGDMDIPPAPSAAGAAGGLGGTGKERVWWVAFVAPLLAAL